MNRFVTDAETSHETPGMKPSDVLQSLWFHESVHGKL
jgi:hypothetical protein